MMRAGTQRRVALLLRLLGGGVLVGAAIGGAAGSAFRDVPLLGASLGGLAGAAQAVILVGAILGTEIFLPRTRLGHALERAPFLVTFAIKLLVYGAVIVFVVGGKPGWRLAGVIADMMPSPDLVTAISVHVMSPTGPGMVRTFLLIGIGVLMLQMSRVVGERTLRDIVITWTAAEGRDGARPVACFFAIEQALARAAPEFEREFGTIPRLRAALHAGPVITGEVGGSRRAIVYHGDVMNTTSRIEHATRDLDRQFLVSGDALARLADLEAFAREDLGPQRLRGRAAAMHVYAVTAKPSTNGQKTI